MVADLSASGSAPNTASIAPGPTSFSRAIAFCVAGLDGSVADRISVTSRSARKFVKKLIQPFRGEPLPARRRRAPRAGALCKARAESVRAGVTSAATA